MNSPLSTFLFGLLQSWNSSSIIVLQSFVRTNGVHWYWHSNQRHMERLHVIDTRSNSVTTPDKKRKIEQKVRAQVLLASLGSTKNLRWQNNTYIMSEINKSCSIISHTFQENNVWDRHILNILFTITYSTQFGLFRFATAPSDNITYWFWRSRQDLHDGNLTDPWKQHIDIEP